MTSLTAYQTGGGGETTAYAYGVTTGSGSAIDSNEIVGATESPDPSTGAASSSQEDVTTVNALGQTVTGTDRNGSTHTLSYDVLGRVVSDAVTTLGTGVDGAVRRIETAYDGQGNAYLFTSYDAASGGTVVNQVEDAYNGLGQMITEWQEHTASVNTSTSPKVQYTYSEMAGGADNSRLTGLVYPNGRTVTYDYGTSGGLNDTISRLDSLKDGGTVLESYSYLGLSTVVVRSHPSTGVDLTYAKRTGESNGDAGDEYIGLDRFGRVVDQRWVVASTGIATDRFQYTYDRDGNRTSTINVVNSAFDETYTYDGLNQLATYAQGASHSQDFDYDSLGNFDSVTTDGGSPVTRTANDQNEITSISGSTTPVYDADGNMIGDENGLTFIYDAWNHLVAVKSGSTTLETLQYDGLNRLVVQNSGTARDLYYSNQWQVLEERVGGSAQVQYVWSAVYVDALIERDRDTDTNSSLDERLFVQQDANWNVTALVDGSGTVVERYTFDAYGSVTIYSPTYSTRTSSLYSETYFFQGRPIDSITGDYNNRMRWYDPFLGRAIEIDPIRYFSGDENFYRWEANGSQTHADPFGLDSVRFGGIYGEPPGLVVGLPGGLPVDGIQNLPIPLAPPQPAKPSKPPPRFSSGAIAQIENETSPTKTIVLGFLPAPSPQDFIEQYPNQHFHPGVVPGEYLPIGGPGSVGTSVGGSHHSLFTLQPGHNQNIVGSGGAETCIILIIRCKCGKDTILGGVFHFSSGDDALATILKYKWPKSGCDAFIAAGKNPDSGVFVDVLEAVDGRLHMPVNVTNSSNLYMDPSGNIYNDPSHQ
jgi:RHS repeat-associated protein